MEHMTYFFETYGCEMNIAESASVEQLLISRGWAKARSAEEAHLVIINTCSVRGTAEQRIVGRLGHFSGVKKARLGKGAKAGRSEAMRRAMDFAEKNGAVPLTLVVMGCMAQRLLDTLKEEHPVVDYVVGTFAKHRFGHILQAVEEKREPFKISGDDSYVFADNSYEQGAFSTFVPIMHGCNKFCTYCIVPYVRGREQSRPADKILQEIDFLSRQNVKEITLLGQNVNAYRSEDGTAFPGLLQRICDHLDKTHSPIRWIRFESSNPDDFSDELISVAARNLHVCKGFHIAAQHGSNEVLRRMNRKNTREDFLALAEKLREACPTAQLATDLMVGFPGETEEQFGQLLSFMEAVKFESAFMYYFNPREGTPAATYKDQIDIAVKKARLKKVIDVQLLHTAEVMAKRVGETIEVLADIVSRDDESELLGKTEQNERVAFKGARSMTGSFVRVRLNALSGNTFRGTVV